MNTLIADDFTLDKYEKLCKCILNKYTPITVYDSLTKYRGKTGFAIFRHDIDRYPRNALNMAVLEHKIGICATYYFRYPFTFNKDIMDKIANMGHEVGYHYECLAKTKGDFEKAIIIFKYELEIFRKAGYSISTICAHGGSLFYSNTELWHHNNLSNFGIVGEAYTLLLEDENLAYFSDTGRTWGSAASKTYSKMPPYEIRGTDELIDIIKTNKYGNVCILAHSERWAFTNLEWVRSLILDCIFNTGKSVLISIRR